MFHRRRPKRSSFPAALLSWMWTSNGEVEGPDDHAGQATRAHTVPGRPRRLTAHASRTPPTIVRARLATWTPLPLARDAVVVPVHLHIRAMRQEVLRLGA